ncbi:MAG: hypothetical protein ACRCVA_29620 [Phreatobacter sp.]
MTPKPEPLPFAKLEMVYERLAVAIDQVGATHEALFLTKLVMVMAQRAGETLDFADCLTVAARDLAAPSNGPVP